MKILNGTTYAPPWKPPLDLRQEKASDKESREVKEGRGGMARIRFLLYQYLYPSFLVFLLVESLSSFLPVRRVATNRARGRVIVHQSAADSLLT